MKTNMQCIPTDSLILTPGSREFRVAAKAELLGPDKVQISFEMPRDVFDYFMEEGKHRVFPLTADQIRLVNNQVQQQMA